jgi:hypothetical protein
MQVVELGETKLHKMFMDPTTTFTFNSFISFQFVFLGGHWVLKFYTTYVKQDIVLGGYICKEFFFHALNLLNIFLTCTHLNHIKLIFFF